MKPNDNNAKLPPEQRPFRVLIISGSDRRQYNCPGVDSKSRMLMLRMAELLPKEWEIDYEDLGMCMPDQGYKVVMHVFLPQWRFVYGHAIVIKKMMTKNRT